MKSTSVKKKEKKAKWFTKDGSKSYVMVPAMPGSKLKKKIEERLKALNLPEKIKIVEKSGHKFSEVLKYVKIYTMEKQLEMLMLEA